MIVAICLSDLDLAVWQSQALQFSNSGRSHLVTIYLLLLQNNSYCLLYVCLLTKILSWLLKIVSIYYLKCNFQSNYIVHMVMVHWCTLFYSVLICWFLLVTVILTILDALSAFFLNSCIGLINPGTFCTALRFRWSGASETSRPLSRAKFNSFSCSQLSPLSSGLFKTLVQLSQL